MWSWASSHVMTFSFEQSLSAELPQRPLQVDADGPAVDAQRPGDLIEGEPLQVPKREGGGLAGGEPREPLPQARPMGRPLERPFGGRGELLDEKSRLHQPPQPSPPQRGGGPPDQ